MIKCPNCSEDNNIQRFCGNCGSQLLMDGVELKEIAATAEIIRHTHTGWLYSFRSIILKSIIWLTLLSLCFKLTFTGAFHLIGIVNDFILIRKSYFFVLSLAILFLA